MAEQYNSDIVWAAAAAAHRINNGYIKEGYAQSKKANKFLIRDILRESIDTIKDCDVEVGKQCRMYWRNQLLAVLGGADDYTQWLIRLATMEKIGNLGDLSVVSSAINAQKNHEQRENTKLEKLSLNSQWVGKIGEKLEFKDTARILTCKYIDKFDRYIVECVIDGNLYFWWGNKKVTPETKILSGKVKAHSRDQDSDQKRTQLNYVKVKECSTVSKTGSNE